MVNEKRIPVSLYVLADFTSTSVGFILFAIWRAGMTRFLNLNLGSLLSFFHLILITFLVSLGWVLLYFFSGSYRDLYQKSRLVECLHAIGVSLLGTIGLFFLYFLLKKHSLYQDYYNPLFVLFFLETVCNLTARMYLLVRTRRQLRLGMVGYNTLIIGANQKAIRLYQNLNHKKSPQGFQISGFIYANPSQKNGLGAYLPNFGPIEDLEHILHERKIDQVILAMEKSEQFQTEKIINGLSGKDVLVRVIPDLFDILSGSVKLDNVYGTPLIEINSGPLPDWKQQVKRLIDISGSALGLILLSPLLAYLAIRVKASSRGPVFYRQERVGLKGRPFYIFKFRSMVEDAEEGTPLLSMEEDPRVTSWGRKMRKWKLDELPQLWNILKGEMSLVGPRPERAYFVDQILERNQFFRHLLRLKPGLTSWGMVQFGYAHNVDEMIERMQFDLIYMENVSISLDMKIMIHTLLTIFKKQGKRSYP